MINQLQPHKNNIRFTPEARGRFGLVWFGLVYNPLIPSRQHIILQKKNQNFIAKPKSPLYAGVWAVILIFHVEHTTFF
jgi:hypothetical protein